MKNLSKKDQEKLVDIYVAATMLVTMFNGKSKRKRREAIKLLKIDGYGHDILRNIRKLDKLIGKYNSN